MGRFQEKEINEVISTFLQGKFHVIQGSHFVHR